MNKIVSSILIRQNQRLRQFLLTNRNYLSSQASDTAKVIDMKLDLNKLSKAQQMYINRLNMANLKRYEAVQRRRKIARYMGTALFVTVFSIYFYTMFAIKQEKFLDNFDIPEPPDQNQAAKAKSNN
jgi:hypothetical protein